MRQKTFIKQTSLAILLYFICLALAVAIDLIFFKVEATFNVVAECGYGSQGVNQCAVVAVHCLAAVEVG